MSDAVTVIIARSPSTQATTVPAYARNAISPCASVNARMNIPLPIASKPRSRLLRTNLSPKRISPANPPSVKPPIVPTAARQSTITTSLRKPERKSSCAPEPARPASFGSSAACTA